ncbi:MAG TPA: ATP-binding protein [Chloroflexi bacterium]|nr:ATP-binding protein [Chloroflexota bacterium]
MKAIQKFLDHSIVARVPILVWGSPGVGKSATIVAWAKTRGFPCWTVIASLREPSDFAGLPVINPDGSSVYFAPPRFAREAEARGGVIFLDELTTAPPAVQAALLRAVMDRAFGDLELNPSRVAIVAAANPPDEATGGWDLAPPLANRFAHVRFTLDPEDWITQFPSYWGAAPKLAYQADEIDPVKWTVARSLVAAFLRARPAHLLQVPAFESARGGPWPSPRSWDYASRLIAQADGADGDLLDAVASCVGEGPAMEFAVWRREVDLPDPWELLEEPETYRHPTRKDIAYAVLAAVVSAARYKLGPKTWTGAWAILTSAVEAGGADVAAAAARSLAAAQKPDLPVPEKALDAFLPVFRQAELV